MKKSLKWLIPSLIVALLVAAGWRTLSLRQSQKTAGQAASSAPKAESIVVLLASDLVVIKSVELHQGLAISGSLRAVNSAWIKARVAGELQGLSVREGDPVQAGQVIARVDAAEFQARVRQAQQQAAAARAQVDIAQRSFDNNNSLVKQGFISKTALESSLAALAGAEANFQAAQAGVDVATKSLQDTVLRAPITGLIAQRLAQSGERVAIDARIVEIVDLSRLELEATLSPSDSLAVRVGQQAQLSIEGASQRVAASVVRINPSVVSGSRAVLAYLALAPSPGLHQGLFAQGTLATGSTRTLAVPLDAVRTDKPLPYVQVVSQGQVTHQTVQLGLRGEDHGQALVGIQGVPENTLVLSGTVGALRAGSRVQTPASAP
jgi:RND family efflux transporter MFP subunit